MEAVVIRDEKPTMNGREEWGTTTNKTKQGKKTEKNDKNTNSGNNKYITTGTDHDNICDVK